MSGKIMWGREFTADDRFLTVSALLIGGGYAIMTATTPNEEEFYNSLSPELKKKVDEVRRQRAGINTELQDKLNEAGDQGKVVWADDLKKKDK